MAANPVISEFMASNSTTLADCNGSYGDWVEIQNTGDAAANLSGWHLTDNSSAPAEWTFPVVNLSAGGFLVVFADGTNTTDPAGYLHTNFSLSADGETLQLTRPNLTVASAWNPDGTAYPQQKTDVSYGTGTIYSNTTLIAPGAAAGVYVPTDSSLDANQWTAVGYNSSSWTTGATGIGYDTGGYEDNSIAPQLIGDWNADDLASTVSNGGKVSTWADEVDHAAAANTTPAKQPTLAAGDFNGHAGVHFDAASSTQLRVSPVDNPMALAGDFTVAFVFKTTTGTAANSYWYNNAGVVDGYESASRDCWGTGVSSTGNIGAGLGNPATTVYSASTVTDGRTHVVVLSRTGGSYTLYTDGGNGVTGSCGAGDLDYEGLVFGSLQTNTHYFTGDLAEVQVFDGAEETAPDAYAVAQPLAAKYGATLTAATTRSFPAITGDWLGDSVASLGNGASVSNWTSNVSGTAVSAAASSVDAAPTVSTNQLNGHTVVSFNGSASDQLRVPAAVNPMSGAGNFSIAVVFRTPTAGVGYASGWYGNTGIVDAEQSGVTDDWGLSIDSAGQIGAGLGNPDETVYSGGLLGDGKAHVAIYTRSGSTTDIYIDGSSTPYESTAGGIDARNVSDMVFGSIQTGRNYFTGDLAEVRVYGGALTGDQAGAAGHRLATKYGVATTPSPYAPYIATNIQSAMSGLATTADIRIPFTVPGAVSQYDQLLLQIQYDDGFVAYLNGTEVVRENAPAGPITFQSVAPAMRTKANAITPQTIDLSAYLSLLAGNGAVNVLSIKALNTSLTDPDLLILPQLSISTSTVGPAYFTSPTPGKANGFGYYGFVATPTISVPHGYYSSSFTTTIADTTPGATIYYTTDGSDPSPTNGTAVTGGVGTVTISASTPLRAAAYLNAYVPSTITTVSYLFVSSVLAQTDTAPTGAYWSSAVDPAIVNLTQTYNVSQALLSLPAMSISLPFDDMFGPLGLYPNPNQRGDAWEKAASLEFFDPGDSSVGFQIDAGIRIEGGADRSPLANEPKKSFRFYFRSTYGASKLDYPLFGTGDPQQSFDHITLKGIHNYSWANEGATDPTQGDLLRDAFARDLQLQLTGHAVRDRWVQLYIDGQYWGLYDVTEDADSTWAAANFGGTKDDYDIVKPDGTGGVGVDSGTGTAYQNLFDTLDTDFTDGVISPAEYTALTPLVDTKGLIDYMLSNFYRGDIDSPVVRDNPNEPGNFYAFRNATTNGPFEFTTWDGEFGLTDVNYDHTGVLGVLNPATLFQDLKTDPDFAQLVADETYRLFYNGGPLQSAGAIDNPMATYDAHVAQINVAIVGESAKWGETQTTYPLTRDDTWIPEINNLDTNYFPGRSTVVLNQIKAISQFSMLAVLPPSFAVNGSANRGGIVTLNSTLSLTDTNAATAGDVIYYTLDGTDPRLIGGNVSSSAHVYTGSISVAGTETVTVRILNGSTWSPIDSVRYSVTQLASAANLSITEVNYHPDSPTAAESAVNAAWTDSDFEFIELLNTSASPVDLTGIKFDAGVTLTLGSSVLAAGGRAVVVSNPTAFAARYGTGVEILGTYSGHLSNSGATIDLKSASNAVIANFTYADTWYDRTDGHGSSLEAVSTTGNYNLSSDWRASYELNGTPGSAGSPVTDVVINEVVSAPASGQQDAVELYNTTTAAIDIGGWYLSDSANNLTAYAFPADTVIAAGQYLVVTAASFVFGINGTSGDSLYLVKPGSTGKPYAFADSDVLGTSAIGESFGRVVTPGGTYFDPQSSITLGAVNSGPRVGPLAITELLYNASSGNSNLQYIEVQNQTNATLNVAGYQFSNGVTYTFPAGTILVPYEAVTLVHFNPTTDATSLAAFRAAYGIDATARLLGPYTGTLANKGEQVTIVRPDAPRSDAPGYTPLILVDDLTYSSTAPWPVTAAGVALTRLSNHDIAEDDTNWTAASPTVDKIPYGNAYFGGDTHYTYPTAPALDSLNLYGDAAVTLAAGLVARFGSISIPAGTQLEFGTVDLDIATGSAASIQALIGNTLTSAAVVNDATHVTMIAVVKNNATGTPLFGTTRLFDGISPGPSDVLVKRTYFGDANLDGRVDGSDYTLIDNAFQTGTPAAWQAGDFNADGVIDGSDYSLIDNAYNRQTTAIPSSRAATPAAAIGTGLKPVAPLYPSTDDTSWRKKRAFWQT